MSSGNLEEMTPDERNRIEFLHRVAQILRMPPDELIKECDEIMARKDQPEPTSFGGPAIPFLPYIPLALRK